ncbi:MAG: S8 family serine peptidase, partial [Thermoguttaceae bacterium]|nr:S8 family serine peptidase [Thermoguttaceae bacterium]
MRRMFRGAERLFSQIVGRGRTGRRNSPRAPRVYRLHAECLEERTLLSIGGEDHASESVRPVLVPPDENVAELQRLDEMDAQKLVGLERRLAGGLAEFYRDFADNYRRLGRDRAAAAAETARQNDWIWSETSRPRVGVSVVIADAGAFSTALGALREFGYEEFAGELGLLLSQGSLPVWAVPEALQIAGVSALGALYQPITYTGLVTTQGDAAMNADDVRAAAGGLDGSGVKVGVMSDSADRVGSGIAASQATGDLPAVVEVLRDGPADADDEGRAMMELIHDVAPGASLAFRSAFWGELDFARGIHELADAGCDVIVDDVGYLLEPAFADGPVAQAVDHVVNTHGVAYFSAAGNQADKSYEAPYRDSQPQTWNTTYAYASGANLHDFDPGSGVDVTLRVTVPAGAILTLQWDQAWYTPGEPVSDFDLYVYDTSGNLITSSEGDNALFRMPWEGVLIASSGSYDLQINHVAGPEAVRLKILAWSSSVAFNEYAADAGKGTIVGHAAAEGAAAVAAARYSSYASGGIESYSSRGQPTIYLDGQYQRLAAPQTRAKPDFTAPDGGNTTFFYSDDGDPDSYPNFYGTSAAAPHAAAVAALILQQRPSLAPEQVYQVLGDTATDWGTAGWDRVYGAG